MKQLPWAIPRQSMASHLSLLMLTIHPSFPYQPPQSSFPPATSSPYHPVMTSPPGRYLQLRQKLEQPSWARLGSGQELVMVVAAESRSRCQNL